MKKRKDIIQEQEDILLNGRIESLLVDFKQKKVKVKHKSKDLPWNFDDMFKDVDTSKPIAVCDINLDDIK